MLRPTYPHSKPFPFGRSMLHDMDPSGALFRIGTVAALALSSAAASAADVRVRISGMSCVSCEAKVTDALDALAFLSNSTASTPSKQACATVVGPLDSDAITAAIEALSYRVTAVEELENCTIEKSRFPDNWAETDGLDVAVISRGEEVSLESHLVSGKFTIFDFGAPWCGPCHVAEKLLKDYLRDHSDVAVRAVILDAQDANQSFAMDVVNQHLLSAPGLPYFILASPSGKIISKGSDLPRILKKIDKRR